MTPHPHRRVVLDTHELHTWADLTGRLAAWLTCPARAVTTDHQQRHPHGPTLPQQAWELHHLTQRIHSLLEINNRPEETTNPDQKATANHSRPGRTQPNINK
jgi:hypothetical protein